MTLVLDRFSHQIEQELLRFCIQVLIHTYVQRTREEIPILRVCIIYTLSGNILHSNLWISSAGSNFQKISSSAPVAIPKIRSWKALCLCFCHRLHYRVTRIEIGCSSPSPYQNFNSKSFRKKHHAHCYFNAWSTLERKPLKQAHTLYIQPRYGLQRKTLVRTVCSQPQPKTLKNKSADTQCRRQIPVEVSVFSTKTMPATYLTGCLI